MLPADLLLTFESEALLGEFEGALAAWIERMHDDLIALLDELPVAYALA